MKSEVFWKKKNFAKIFLDKFKEKSKNFRNIWLEIKLPETTEGRGESTRAPPG